MVLATTAISPETIVRERLEVWQRAGVDTVRLYPAGETLPDRLAILARGVHLVRELDTDG